MLKDLSSLFALRDLRTFPLATMQLIIATRLSIIFGQSGRDPLPDLAVRLRSMDAALRIEGIVDTLQHHWPDQFLVYRPCCMTLTPDEALLGDLATCALNGDWKSASMVLRDTLPADRARPLFNDAVGALAAIRCAASQAHSATK